MRRHLSRLLPVALLIVCSRGLSAQENKYSITAAERTACTSDATRLCAAAYPDEDKLMDCLSANRKSLSAACLLAFDAGMKKRGLR